MTTGTALNAIPGEQNVLPLELEYPGLAEGLRLVACGEHPRVKTVDAKAKMIHIISNDGKHKMISVKVPDRNSPCPCGSGKKYKKCCGR